MMIKQNLCKGKIRLVIINDGQKWNKTRREIETGIQNNMIYMWIPYLWEFCVWSLFCNAVLSVLFYLCNHHA